MDTTKTGQGSGCCESQPCPQSTQGETITIRRTTASCGLCDRYVEAHRDRTYAVVSCEGACLRGEISRQAANILCHSLAPAATVRICSGSALTKDSGQRSLLRNASRVLILEGCVLDCASRSLEAVVPTMSPIVIHTDALAEFDKGVFGVDEIDDPDVRLIAGKVAREIMAKHMP